MINHAMTGSVPGAIALALACTAVAPAEVLHPSWIDADARWVAHVDLEAFHGSTLGRYLSEHGAEHGINLEEIDELEADIGLDPRTDVMSVTAYGGGEGMGASTVVLAVTNQKADEAVARLSSDPNVEARVVDLGGYPVHELLADGERHFVHVRATDRDDRRLVVVADRPEELVDALRVLDGERVAMNRGRTALSPVMPQPGSMLFVSVTDLDGVAAPQTAVELSRLANTVIVDVGELENHLFTPIRADTGNPDDARNVADVLEGAVAFGKLAIRDEPDLAPIRTLLDGTTISAEGTHVALDLRYDAKTIVDQLDAASVPDP